MDLIRTKYPYEHLLIAATMLVSVAGFWNVYVGAAAAPEPHHHLHVTTVFAWLLLLLYQLRLVDRGRHAEHRRVGLLVLLVAPVLFAASALLSVHSAHRGLASGQGDFLIVQNVGVTLQLGVLIVLAFALRRQRRLHAAFLLSTAILFLGIALFFALIGFVPQFRIEGPETFHRFESAAKTAQAISTAVAVAFFLKDVRNNWPFLLAGSFFLANETIRAALSPGGGVDALTRFVGSLDRTAAFAAGFVLLSALLAGTGLLGRRAAPPGPGGRSPRT